jgi:hypothetical protein
MKTNRYPAGAGRIALTAMLAAFSLTFLYGASLTPSGQLGLVAAAGVFPAAALVSGGYAAGFLCYAASALLALVLVPDKGGAVLYLLFFGIYPLVKHLIEKLRIRVLEWMCKLILCNAALGLFLRFLRALLLAELPAFFGISWVFFLAGNAAFVLYDTGFPS